MDDIIAFPAADHAARFLNRVIFDFPDAGYDVILEEWGDQDPPAPARAYTTRGGRRLVARLVSLTTGEIHHPRHLHPAAGDLPGRDPSPSPSPRGFPGGSASASV